MSSNEAGLPPGGPSGVADFGDADLVLRTRSGDTAAFGELWRRHYPSGLTVARSVTSSLDADDLVQEAYTRIYQSILTGGGPTGSFRAYLFTSIRNTAATWGRARRETPIDALDTVEDPATSEQATTAALDHGLTHRAFRSLPTRWQEVLWYSEIEQMKPAEIAPLLGLKATAVAQLTFRAREGLREAWIQAHLRSVADGSDCQWTIEHLGAHARANLGRRDRAKVESHLARCARCAIVASEAKEVSGRLALVLLPLTVGAVGTAGYLASIQGGGAPLTALAAMPSSVMPGAVTVFPGLPDISTLAMGAAGIGSAGTGTAGVSGAAGSAATAGSSAASAGTAGASAMAGAGSAGAAAAGGSAGAAGAAGSAGAAAAAGAGSAGALAAAGAGSAGVAATAAAAGGILSGLTAMTGLAAAGLVIVGSVVAGAVVLPGIDPSSNPADDRGSSLVEDSGTGARSSDESESDLRYEDESESSTADVPAIIPDEMVSPAPPTDVEAESEAGTSAKTKGPAPQAASPASTPHPTTPAAPAAPAVPAPTPPGQGGVDPRPADRIPVLPSGSPAIASTTSYVTPETDQLNIDIVVSGSPGATAQARIRGQVRATGVIGDDGFATLLLQPTAQELRTDARVELSYVNADLTGPPVIVSLAELR